MLPIRDRIPTLRFPLVTVLLLLANIVVFGLQMLILAGGGENALQQVVLDYGVIPAQVTAAPLATATWLTFLTSMFMHGGVMHIFGNMLYLWIFGNNIEDVMGKFWFLAFYLACGVAASLAQVWSSPSSPIPGIGASGAIAGVLAAYLVYFPTARVDTLVIFGFFARMASLPAVIVLGMWFVLQLFNGFLSFGVSSASEGGVAWFAHIGGFVAGLILCLPWIAAARRHHSRRAARW
jgi:membrane associated rhomboid family serine protease